MKNKKLKTPPTVLAFEINRLAKAFYSMSGYQVEDGYKFNKAHHPQEILMWNMALLAYDTFKSCEGAVYHDYYLTYDRYGYEKNLGSENE